jgi:hypothetical protein
MKEDIKATTKISVFLELFKSQNGLRFTLHCSRKRFKSASPGESLDELLTELIPDPTSLFEKCRILTLRIDTVDIPVTGESPNLLFWNLGEIENYDIDRLKAIIQDKIRGVIIGTSGCGKTRTIFETLCKTYGLYFNMKKSMEGNLDFNCCIDDLERYKNSEISPDTRHRVLEQNILCLVMSRLAVLEFLLEKSPKSSMTPEMWLLIQLRFNFLPVYREFQRLHPEELKFHSRRLSIFAQVKLNTRMPPIFLDDAQYAVTMHEKCFPSYITGIYWLLWSVLLTSLCLVLVSFPLGLRLS